MIKAGIVTIHMIRNYGAVAQAYALNKYLRLNGIDATTIDFRTYRSAESYRYFFRARSLMDVARNLQTSLYFNRLRRRNDKFKDFLKNYVPTTPKTYYSNADLENDDLNFDYYVCGSDQIWNTFCRNYDDAFILRFARGKGKRLSYAASLGVDSINDNMKRVFADELSDFCAISVRESSAAPVIEKICGKSVASVLDPVFLLDREKWSEIASPRIVARPYIFFYYVKGDIPDLRRYVKRLSRLTGLPIVIVGFGLRDLTYFNVKRYDAGVEDFLSLIKNAEYVATNSFHGTSFSIIFGKKFMVFNDKKNGASRINSLLELCGISDRQVDSDDNCDKMFAEIQYADVYEKLNSAVKESKDFLAKSMRYERVY